MKLNLRILNVVFALLTIREVIGHKCGVVDFIDPRILGGTQTTRGAWPFIVALYNIEQSRFFCGGTIISAKHVLTAAHCIQVKNSVHIVRPEDITVLLGAYNLGLKIERGTQQRDVDEIHLHSDWKMCNENYEADLAILVLSDIVDFTNYIRPICMPSDDNLIDGAMGMIVGWKIFENAIANNHRLIPRESVTVALNASNCYTANRFIDNFSSNHTFCGGCKDGAFKGDSGGGFFIYSNSAWVQLGIFSSSVKNIGGDVIKYSTSIYTNVKSFTNWIGENVKNTGSGVMTVAENIKTKIDLGCYYEFFCRFQRQKPEFDAPKTVEL